MKKTLTSSIGVIIAAFIAFLFLLSNAALVPESDNNTSNTVRLTASEAVDIPNPPVTTADYLDEFLNEISGNQGKLTTESIIEAARWILEIQKCADNYGK